jgi:hypothetical protein
MPSYVEYLSDASMSEDSSDEDDMLPLYDPRDEDYWAIEALLDTRKPPPILEYASSLGVFTLRECIVGPLRKDIESVVDVGSKYSWKEFWSGAAASVRANITHKDWDAIGEFCFVLCSTCYMENDMDRVRSCIIRILSYGHFKSIR